MGFMRGSVVPKGVWGGSLTPPRVFPPPERKLLNPFSVPDLYGRLEADPRTRALLGDPEYRRLLEQLRSNPAQLGTSVRGPGERGAGFGVLGGGNWERSGGGIRVGLGCWGVTGQGWELCGDSGRFWGVLGVIRTGWGWFRADFGCWGGYRAGRAGGLWGRFWGAGRAIWKNWGSWG